MTGRDKLFEQIQAGKVSGLEGQLTAERALSDALAEALRDFIPPGEVQGWHGAALSRYDAARGAK